MLGILQQRGVGIMYFVIVFIFGFWIMLVHDVDPNDE